MTTRRDFVKLAGASALAAWPILQTQGAKAKSTFNLGIAGYTFLAYNNNIEKIIEVMKAVDVKYISLKNFQLPYNFWVQF